MPRRTGGLRATDSLALRRFGQTSGQLLAQVFELKLEPLHATGKLAHDLVEILCGALGKRRSDLELLHPLFDRGGLLDHGRSVRRKGPRDARHRPLVRFFAAAHRAVLNAAVARPRLRTAWLLLSLTGCLSFFDELESDEQQGTGEPSSDGSGGDDAACVFPDDEHCMDQDLVLICDRDTGEPTVWDCGAQCGQFVNFACVNTGAGHGCWCVEPGGYKQYSCSELEDCLRGCTTATSSACADACFARTDRSTARMYGALVSCAHQQCRDLCLEAPEGCARCVEVGIADGAGECGLARSVCDADRNDEPFSEYE